MFCDVCGVQKNESTHDDAVCVQADRPVKTQKKPGARGAQTMCLSFGISVWISSNTAAHAKEAKNWNPNHELVYTEQHACLLSVR